MVIISTLLLIFALWIIFQVADYSHEGKLSKATKTLYPIMVGGAYLLLVTTFLIILFNIYQ